MSLQIFRVSTVLLIAQNYGRIKDVFFVH